MVNNKKKIKSRRSNVRTVKYTGGQPTKSNRGSVGWASSAGDLEQVHSIANPFSSAARGSKLPDTDSSKSVAVSIVSRTQVSTIGAGGHWAAKITSNPQSSIAEATTITGAIITTFGAAASIPDYTAMSTQFSKKRLVSWGVKVFPTVAPTAQSGQFQMITDPTIANGINTSSSFHEENLSYPNSEATVQWISKPIGNQYLEYTAFNVYDDWDQLCIFANGLSTINGPTHIIEVFYNYECQVSFGQLAAAIATPAAESKPHVLAAVAHVHKQAAGSKLAAEVKSGMLDWVRGAIGRAMQVGEMYLGNKLRGTAGGGRNLISQYAHIPMVD